MNNVASRILGIIFTTFLLAALYGLFCTTADFMNEKYDPEASGHRAAASVYSLFGEVSTEIKNNDANASPKTISVAHRIATPYAMTADICALLGGKLEIFASSFFHSAVNAADRVAPPEGTKSTTATTPAR